MTTAKALIAASVVAATGVVVACGQTEHRTAVAVPGCGASVADAQGTAQRYIATAERSQPASFVAYGGGEVTVQVRAPATRPYSVSMRCDRGHWRVVDAQRAAW